MLEAPSLQLVCDVPLSVGVVRWGSFLHPSALSIFAKATFDLSKATGVDLAQAQLPLSLDQEDQTAPHVDSLRYASDFVPYKHGVDVCVVGHARGPRTDRGVRARLAVGSLDRTVVVADPEGRGRPRLDPGSITELDGRFAGGIGPSAAPHPALVGDWHDADEGLFNSAGSDQRLPTFTPASMPITMEGLLGDGEARTIRLPPLAPTVAVFHPPRGLAGILLMTADTMWIDCDDEVCVVVWRAVHSFFSGPAWQPKSGREPLVLAISAFGDSTIQQLRKMGQSLALKPVVERHQLESASTQTLDAHALQHATASSPEEERTTPNLSTAQIAAARQKAEFHAVEQWSETWPTPVRDASPPQSTLPFSMVEEQATLAAESTADPLSEDRTPRSADSSAAASGLVHGLPFVPQGPRAHVQVLPERFAERGMADEPTQTQDSELAFERYANIRADLFRGDQSVDDVLAKHGLTMMTWRAEHEQWQKRLADEAAAGETSLSSQLLLAMTAARDTEPGG